MAYITRSYFYYFYRNYKCNDICCFFLLIYIFCLIVPFFFAYQTDGFWDKMRDYNEQPHVHFKGQIAVECQSKDNSYFYSNIPEIAYLNQYSIKPSLQVFQINLDITQSIAKKTLMKIINQKIYEVSLLFHFYLFHQQVVHFCSFIMLGQEFQSDVKIQMQAPVIVQINNDFSKNTILIQGQLDFYQKHPLLSSSVTRNIYNNTNFDKIGQLIEIQQQILKRNETLKANFQTYYLPKQGKQVPVQIEINFKIPIFQKIQFIPSLMDNIKTAWQQYIFVFLPLFFFINKLAKFSVKRRIFYAHISTNLPQLKQRAQIQ